jgi:hypothetical protein
MQTRRRNSATCPSVTEVCDLGRAGHTRRFHLPRRSRPRSQTSATGGMRSRHGISLLEVLVSVFVLTVGILGLAALIPIGRFEVMEAGKLDRGATLGKIAFREVLLRNMLQPYTTTAPATPGNPTIEWLAYSASAKQLQDVMVAVPVNAGDPPFKFGLQPPFAIDPMMFADPRNYDAVWGSATDTPVPDTFPYNINADATAAGLQQQRVPKVPRLSLSDFSFKNTTWSQAQQDLAFALADRVFRGRDDLSYVVADDQDARPVQQFQMLYQNSSGQQTTAQEFQEQAVAKRATPSTIGDYSWMVTVSPSLTETYNFNTSNPMYSAGNMRTLDVSVVVFYKRPISLLPPDDNDPPAERTVSMHFAGSGNGGGSAHLSHPDPKYLRELRPNQWIMVTGRLRLDPTIPNPPNVAAPVVAKWYRIVSVDDGSGVTDPPAGEDPHRDVTLDGADWNTLASAGGNMRFDDLNPGTNGEVDLAASIFDGVVAVYERTVRIDSLGK